ncbi:hypothetical protein [Ammoniphilus sp. YIM 78166]|nr:hypothetical protein [Ammoniphilus sp. YIM 78166]
MCFVNGLAPLNESRPNWTAAFLLCMVEHSVIEPLYQLKLS